MKKKRNLADLSDEMTEEIIFEGMKGGKGAPPPPEPSKELINAFINSYEEVAEEYMATDFFDIGRLRAYFQAWMLPRMPDPLPTYLSSLADQGFNMRTSCDGSLCMFLRMRRDTQGRHFALMEECEGEYDPNTGISLKKEGADDDFPDDPELEADGWNGEEGRAKTVGEVIRDLHPDLPY